MLSLLLTPPFSLLSVRVLAFIKTNSCSCLGTSSTALSKVVQISCLLLALCVSVGAYATKNVTALARPRSSSVTFSKRSLINLGGRARRVVEVLTAGPAPSCHFYSPFSPPHSPLQNTRQPAWVKAECPLRRVSCRPRTSHPSRSYTLKISSARPTPRVPSTAIVRTLCVATVIFRLRARARFLVSLCRRRRRSDLPRRLRFRAKNVLLFVIFFYLTPLFLSPLLPCILVSRRGFSRPTPRRSTYVPSPEQIWGLLAGSSPRSRFPRRYASFGAMTVGTSGLTRRFNW